MQTKGYRSNIHVSDFSVLARILLLPVPVPLLFFLLPLPSFSAFNYDGTLNPSAIAQQAAYIKKVGANVVYVNGTTGEGLSQSVAERKRGAEEWVKQG
jgi:hypothetical protein